MGVMKYELMAIRDTERFKLFEDLGEKKVGIRVDEMKLVVCTRRF
tara:strand:- start:119 stop:253 length:135 start_codon:yes stop_codon:yes gene_type:complete